MKNECNIVRDVLPLYVEDMASEETKAFVNEHLINCPACSKAFEEMKEETYVEKLSSETQTHLEEEVLRSMRAIRKGFQKKAIRIGAIIAAVIIALGVLIDILPLYRILHKTEEDIYKAQEYAVSVFGETKPDDYVIVAARMSVGHDASDNVYDITLTYTIGEDKKEYSYGYKISVNGTEFAILEEIDYSTLGDIPHY